MTIVLKIRDHLSQQHILFYNDDFIDFKLNVYNPHAENY